MVEIRVATMDDFEGILPLFGQLQPKIPLEKGKIRTFFQEMLASPNHMAWIANLDGEIVGYMDVVFRAYHFAFGFTARIETTIVDDEHRRKGVATLLLKECEKEAANRGCRIIELDSAMERTQAHQFYETNGYSKRGYLFWKKI
ncbi:MAG: GNAT family N-acetyltransferase [Candidatus Micrarchaeota archaeon]